MSNEIKLIFCSICTEKYSSEIKPIKGACNHTFCQKCVDNLDNKKTCTLCKKEDAFIKSSINREYLKNNESIERKLIEQMDQINWTEKCSYHPLVSSYSYCYDDKKFLCTKCINNHIGPHTVRIFKENSFNILNDCHKKGKNIKSKYVFKIAQDKKNFIEKFLCVSKSVIENEINTINSVYQDIQNKLEDQKKRLIGSIKLLQNKINSFIEPFRRLDDSLLDFFIESNKPYVSPFLSDSIDEDTRISFYEFTSNEINKDKIIQLIDESNSDNKNKSKSLIVTDGLKETYEVLINEIHKLQINTKNMIQLAVQVKDIPSSDEFLNLFNEETLNNIMNKSILEISKKLSFL